MPKVNDIQLAERIRKRIAELDAGEEVAAKDIQAVLTDEQQAAIDTAWAEQQQLRKGKRARTEQEQQELGWRTKRDIRLEVLRQALEQAENGTFLAFEKLIDKTEKQRNKIYLDAYFEKIKQGKSRAQASSWANNELTRAGLNRLDGARVNSASKRDREVRELDEILKAEIKKNMTKQELEQQEILREHEASLKRKKKKRN